MSDSTYVLQVEINGEWRNCMKPVPTATGIKSEPAEYPESFQAVTERDRRLKIHPNHRFRVIRKRTVVEIVA